MNNCHKDSSRHLVPTTPHRPTHAVDYNVYVHTHIKLGTITLMACSRLHTHTHLTDLTVSWFMIYNVASIQLCQATYTVICVMLNS